jgi:hypothetical protein
MRTARLLSTPVRRPLPVLFLILAAGLFAACGGGGSTTKTAAPATTAAPAAAGSSGSGNGFAAYTQCLRSHGVTSFGPGAGSSTSTPGTTVSQATMNAARQACANLRPSGTGAGGGAGALNGPAAAAYRTCLQQHGVTLPAPGQTPTTAAGGAGSAAGGGTGRGGFANNPAFQAAAQACASLRPARSTTPSIS